MLSIYLLFFLWLVGCTLSRSEEVAVEAVTVNGEEDEVLFLTAPQEDPLFWWTEQCATTDEHWWAVVEALLPVTGAHVYDLSAGFGHSFVRLAMRANSAIAVERDTTKTSYLQENIARFDLWSKTLVVNYYNASDAQGRFAITPERSFFRELFAMLSLQCPHLLHFRENGDSRQDLWYAFTDWQFLLSRCMPLLYLDFQSPREFVSFAKALQLGFHDSERKYALYLIPLCCTDENQESNQREREEGERERETKRERFGLLAIDQQSITEREEELFHSHRLISLSPSLSSPAMEALLRSVCSSRTENVMREYLGRVEVDFDMLSYPFGTLHCLYEETRRNKTLSSSWQAIMKEGEGEEHEEDSLFSLSVDVFDDKERETENYNEVLLSTRCSEWIAKIVERLRFPLSPASSSRHRCERDNLTEAHIEHETHNALSNCFRFVNSRLDFLRAIYKKRDKSDVELRVPLSCESQYAQYAYYDFSPQQRGRDWFARAPLASKYEEDLCAEPIFCAYGERLRDAVQRWQFPPLFAEDIHRYNNDNNSNDRNSNNGPISSLQQSANNESDDDLLQHLKDVAVVQNEDDKKYWRMEKLRKSMKNTFPNPSCDRAKYLVYEPPSYHHGIGAMVLLIASALRYAICLDRILVFSTHEQHNTLLKWQPPGCNVNTFECYFQPISSCSLSLSELDNVTFSTTGEGFAEFPLREEKVLFLRGVPESGPCRLCFSEWTPSSRFFDGFLHMVVDGRKVSDIYAQVFTHPMKLPWLSQLTRNVLRPRKWLAHAIEEIAAATMLSPATVMQQQGRGKSEKAKFPRNFISLHIRHGWKRVETTLFKPEKYMRIVQSKFPWVKDIFVSTETQHIIHSLIRDYPQYNFHFLNYDRIEFLPLNVSRDSVKYDYPSEFIYSLANLHIAAEASGFLGSLTSSWCMLIQYVERTRGDGGFEYFSVDRGTVFTSCY